MKKRFKKIYTQGSVNGMEIWLDRETGVQYLYHFHGSGGGITPLLDSDGKPVVTPRESAALDDAPEEP